MSRVVALVGLLLSCALSPFASAAGPKVTGMLSKLHLGTEDVSGVVLYVMYSHGHYYGSLQCAQGGPGIPETVELSVTGSSVSFSVPANSASGCAPGATFSGEVSATGIKGSFADTDWPGFLKRGKGYWQ